jgi:hypothetical protein
VSPKPRVLVALLVILVVASAGAGAWEQYLSDQKQAVVTRTVAYNEGLEAGHGDVAGIFASYTPPRDCVLIIIDENSRDEVCKGEKLYTVIMEDWPYAK